MKDKCDSELERKVLDEIVNQKLPLPDDAQKMYFDGDVPVAKADFYYELSKNKIYVFVDGPPHHDEQKQKEDKVKRDIIESKGFTLITLDFKNSRYLQDPSLI